LQIAVLGLLWQILVDRQQTLALPEFNDLWVEDTANGPVRELLFRIACTGLQSEDQQMAIGLKPKTLRSIDPTEFFRLLKRQPDVDDALGPKIRYLARELDYVVKQEPFLEKWTLEYGNDTSLPSRSSIHRITVNKPLDNNALRSIRPGGRRLGNLLKADDVASRSNVLINSQNSGVQGVMFAEDKLQTLPQTEGQHIIGEEYQAMNVGEPAASSLYARLSAQITGQQSGLVGSTGARRLFSSEDRGKSLRKSEATSTTSTEAWAKDTARLTTQWRDPRRSGVKAVANEGGNLGQQSALDSSQPYG
jgi:hypothetical protein